MNIYNNVLLIILVKFISFALISFNIKSRCSKNFDKKYL